MGWLETAEGLKAGRKTRIRCCGTDNSMLVSHTEKGYQCHCFRCGAHEFKPHGLQRLDDLIRRRNELAYLDEQKVYLPKDYTLDIPEKEMLWFLQYGISPELARQHRIGWSESLSRIVLPVYDEADELVALQMRSTDPNVKPKYLNPTGPRVSASVFMSGKPTGATVLVEDILSAIKVGRVHHATAMLGLNLTDERAMTIASVNTDVIVWTDNDRAGKQGRLTATRQLLLLGMNTFWVRSECDPKTYNLEEIREHLRMKTKC